MSKHTQGPWSVHSYSPNEHVIPEVWGGDAGDFSDHIRRIEDARLISAAPEYHDAAFWILRAVEANAAPVNPMAALEELALDGKHITLDAGLVLDLLKAHAKATGGEA